MEHNGDHWIATKGEAHWTNEQAPMALDAAIFDALIRAEYPALTLIEADGFQVTANTDDGEAVRLFHDAKPPKPTDLADILEAADQHGIDASEGYDEDEDRKGGSVVDPAYKRQYAEDGHPNHNGDWLAFLLESLGIVTFEGKKRRTDVQTLNKLFADNGIISKDHKFGGAFHGTAPRTNGWEGRFRMSGGLQLSGRRAFVGRSTASKIMPDTRPENRVKGALIGLAIGDALGAPVEFQPRGGFTSITGMRAGGRFRLPAGAWTDDTAMALCLAESLLADPNLDERDLLERFCRWAAHGENSSTGVAVGIGQITLRCLGDFRRTGSLHAAPRGRADGNGALMRVAPVAIRHFHNPRKAADIAIRQSRTTHASVLSDQCCAFTTHLISRLILGEEWSGALAEAQAELQAPELLAMLDRRNTAIEPPSTGYVVDTLEAALWAVARTQSFKEALLAAVNLGHDADTVGAVAGQIAGARYGMGAIPSAWLEALAQSERIEELAGVLLAEGRKAVVC